MGPDRPNQIAPGSVERSEVDGAVGRQCDLAPDQLRDLRLRECGRAAVEERVAPASVGQVADEQRPLRAACRARAGPSRWQPWPSCRRRATRRSPPGRRRTRTAPDRPRRQRPVRSTRPRRRASACACRPRSRRRRSRGRRAGTRSWPPGSGSCSSSPGRRGRAGRRFGSPPAPSDRRARSRGRRARSTPSWRSTSRDRDARRRRCRCPAPASAAVAAAAMAGERHSSGCPATWAGSSAYPQPRR